MILKIQYNTGAAVKSTIIDGIDKVDSGHTDNVQFINVYKSNRKTDDDFTTINITGITAFLMNSDGKTIEVFRSK